MFKSTVSALYFGICSGYLALTLSAMTLDDFVSHTGATLQSLNSNIDPDSKWPEYLVESYNLTGTVVVQQRQILLTGFHIKTKIIIDCMQIFLFDKFGGALFFFVVQYTTTIPPNLKAFLHDIRCGATDNERLSGTEVMLIVHRIMIGIGVKRCSLHNAAKVRYDFWGQRQFIPLIYLRCLRGKTSDWYSDFGYFNDNRAEIAMEMARIHNAPYQDSTFGPWLYALWNQSDITDFQIAYQQNVWRFSWLQKLTLSSDWAVFFQPLE